MPRLQPGRLAARKRSLSLDYVEWICGHRDGERQRRHAVRPGVRPAEDRLGGRAPWRELKTNFGHLCVMTMDKDRIAQRKRLQETEGRAAWEEYQAEASGVSEKIARLRAERL